MSHFPVAKRPLLLKYLRNAVRAKCKSDFTAGITKLVRDCDLKATGSSKKEAAGAMVYGAISSGSAAAAI
jgi:hypothetical protein